MNLKNQVTIRIDEEINELIMDLCNKEKRTVANVARLLLDLGVGQFKQTGELVPEEKKTKAVSRKIG